MNKKFITAIISLILVLSALCACSAAPNRPYIKGHEDHYAEYFPPQNATCREEGSIGYYFCHDCNLYISQSAPYEELTREQAVIARLSHSFRDGVCDICGFDSLKGLEFILISEEIGYKVVGNRNQLSDQLLIPSTHNGKPVVEIAPKAFKDCVSLKEIQIPDSIKRIGISTFEGCFPQKITLPFIGESEEENRFLGFIFGAEFLHSADMYIPSSLKEISLTDNCKTIPKAAFRGCKDLVTINLNKVEAIGLGAFSGCINLQEIKISNIDQWLDITFDSPIPTPFRLTVDGRVVNTVKAGGSNKIQPFTFTNCLSVKTLILSKDIKSFDLKGIENSYLSSIIFEGSKEGFSALTDIDKIQIPLSFEE